MGTEPAPTVASGEPVLTIDPCVDVDEATVREEMALELRDARARRAPLPDSVSVRCVGDAQEIRLTPGTSPEHEEIRTIQLSSVVDAAPAAREARSRELALAIAELIRRRQLAPPAPPEPAPPSLPPPPPAAPMVAVASAQDTERATARWRLGISASYDYFSGGQRLGGGDLFFAWRSSRWFLAEIRAGARTGSEQPLPNGRWSARALTVGAAGGAVFWAAAHPIGVAMMIRVQEYLVELSVDEAIDGRNQTVLLGALTLAAEPRLMVALARHVWLEATAAAGLAPYGIAVRTQGIDAQSISGLVLSTSLGGVLTF